MPWTNRTPQCNPSDNAADNAASRSKARAVKAGWVVLLGAGLLLSGCSGMRGWDESPRERPREVSQRGEGPRGHAGRGERGDHAEHGPLTPAQAAERQQRMTEHLSQRWSLNDEQKQRLGVVLAKWHERRGPAPAGAGAAGADPAKDPRSDLSALIAGDKFNVDKATALTQARADAIRSRSPELIAAAAAFYDGLKPEQQAKVREFLARGPGDGPHNGPHGGPRRMGAMGDDQGARQPG